MMVVVWWWWGDIGNLESNGNFSLSLAPQVRNRQHLADYPVLETSQRSQFGIFRNIQGQLSQEQASSMFSRFVPWVPVT